jgi:hypothetical protein
MTLDPAATAAWTPRDMPATEEGLGLAEVDGRLHRIVHLLAADPDLGAGRDLVAATGTSTGLLVKVFDAGVWLPVRPTPAGHSRGAGCARGSSTARRASR